MTNYEPASKSTWADKLKLEIEEDSACMAKAMDEYHWDESMTDEVQDIAISGIEAKKEVLRLRSMIYGIGFCPDDGDSMPCLTCGAGL